MYYLTATPAYPGTPFDAEIVRIYDNFDAAIEWGDAVADSEDYTKVLLWYRGEIQQPNRIPGGIYIAENAPGVPANGWGKSYAKNRIAELTKSIADLRYANAHIGEYMLYSHMREIDVFPEDGNYNAGMIFATCIKANEDNQKEILRLRKVFEV